MKRILLAFALILIVFPAIAEETSQESEKRLLKAFEFLTENYFYEINTERLVDRLITQMTHDLDQSTRFLGPNRSKRHLNNLQGEDNIYVKSQLTGEKGDILYSRITLFGKDVSKQLAADIFDFSLKIASTSLSRGTITSMTNSINGFILDLRHNSGGWLDESIAMVDMFIDRGLILEKRGRHNNVSERVFSKSKMIMSKRIPIIILVDGDTASAAEIVASALKDHNRVRLLGTTTYGKATVQIHEDFRNGSTLWITSQKYYTKSGVEIHGKGITPNIEFNDMDTVTTFGPNDSPVKKAIELLMSDR